LDPGVFDLPVEKIRDGYYTDAYFSYARSALLADGRHPRVLMQVLLQHLHMDPPTQSRAKATGCSSTSCPRGRSTPSSRPESRLWSRSRSGRSAEP